jgi:hypothetical protein
MKKWTPRASCPILQSHSSNALDAVCVVLRIGSHHVSGLHNSAQPSSKKCGKREEYPSSFRHACRNPKPRHRYVVFPELSTLPELWSQGAHQLQHTANLAAARAVWALSRTPRKALPARFFLAPDTHLAAYDQSKAQQAAIALPDLRPLLAGKSQSTRWRKLLSASRSLRSLDSFLRQPPADLPSRVLLPAAFSRLDELLSRHILSSYRLLPMNVRRAVARVEDLHLQGTPTHPSGTHPALLAAHRVAEHGLFRRLLEPGALENLSMQGLVRVAEGCAALQLPRSHPACKTVWKHLRSLEESGVLSKSDFGALRAPATDCLTEWQSPCSGCCCFCNTGKCAPHVIRI